jgi:protein involved in polysaccharide export with SLBB domain
MDGAVRRPGSFFLRQKMTLQEAILAAGGLAPWSDDDDVSVVRLEGGERKKHTFDMDNMEDWGFPIQNQDVIIVGSNPLLRVWYGFSLGFMGTGYRDPGSK